MNTSYVYSIIVNDERIPFILLFCVFVLIWMLQSVIPLNHDVGWFLYAAAQTLDGAELYSDIVEINPPLIIYLFWIPVVTSKLFGISLILGFRLWMMVLLLLSALSSISLLDRLSNRKQLAVNRYFVLFYIAIIGLLLFKKFGQREEILFLLLLPYLLLQAIRWNRQTVGRLTSIAIGVVAAIGLCLKVHFLVIVLLLEIVIIIKNRGGVISFRAENIALALTGISYVVIVYITTPNYFLFIIPLGLDIYWAYKSHIWHLIRWYHFLLLFLASGGFIVCRSNKTNQALRSILFVAALGAYCAYLLQKTPWVYHQIPFLTLTGSIIALSSLELLRSWFLKDNIANDSSFSWVSCMFLSTTILGLMTIFASVMLEINLLKTFYLDMSNDDSRLKVFKKIVLRDAEIQSQLSDYEAKSFYVFSSGLWPSFPTVLHFDFHWCSRFPSLWLVPALVREGGPERDAESEVRFVQIKDYLFDSVIIDLQKHQPDLVLVDNNAFNFIEYFLSDERFRKEWFQYMFREEIAVDPPLNNYSYKVFTRK